MNWQSFLDKLTSGGIPADAMVGGGIIVLLIALKAAKGVLKIIFILAAFALLIGAAWWHFHKH